MARVYVCMLCEYVVLLSVCGVFVLCKCASAVCCVCVFVCVPCMAWCESVCK